MTLQVELEGVEVGGMLWNMKHKLQILRTARRLAREGAITKDMSQDDIADAIAIGLLDDDRATYEAVDWKKILDLIVQLLPLILAFFG
jgi:hypothetical protein